MRTLFKADGRYQYTENYPHLSSEIYRLVVSNGLEIEHIEEPTWNMSYPDLGDIRPIPAALILGLRKKGGAGPIRSAD